MAKLFKILAIAALMVLVFFSLVAEIPFGRHLEEQLNLTAYIRFASLISLVIAALYIWAYKRQIESAQKYRRADEVLQQAEVEAKRRQVELDHMETRLKADFAKKEAGLGDHIDHSIGEYQNRIKRLQEQNMELKETVAKLMQALKKERSQRPPT